MVALHRVYLEPDGPIYNALMEAAMSPVELKGALNPTSKHYAQAVYVIGEALKNIVARIVDFMVTSLHRPNCREESVRNVLAERWRAGHFEDLGDSRPDSTGKSISGQLLLAVREGNCTGAVDSMHCAIVVQELLEFSKGKLVKITRQRATLLIIGSFLFRGLVTTVVCLPLIESRATSSPCSC